MLNWFIVFALFGAIIALFGLGIVAAAESRGKHSGRGTSIMIIGGLSMFVINLILAIIVRFTQSSVSGVLHHELKQNEVMLMQLKNLIIAAVIMILIIIAYDMCLSIFKKFLIRPIANKLKETKMKEKLLFKPSYKILKSKHNLWWVVLYMLPGLMINAIIGVMHFLTKNPIVIWSLIALFFVWLTWFLMIILLSDYLHFHHHKFQPANKRQVLKWVTIVQCILIDVLLPWSLIGVVSGSSIVIVILFEFALTVKVWHSSHVNVIYQKQQKED